MSLFFSCRSHCTGRADVGRDGCHSCSGSVAESGGQWAADPCPIAIRWDALSAPDPALRSRPD